MEQLSAASSRAHRLLLAFLAMAMLPCEADAAARRVREKAKLPECPVTGSHTVSFAKAVDGTSFLTADGLEVRLAGVLAPGRGGETVPLTQSDAAREALAAVLRSAPLMVAADEAVHDRYGRLPAQVFAGETWVQGILLRAGELRASPDRSSALCAKELLAAEDEGRLNRAGRWRDGIYALRTPEQLRNRTGTFQMVEGTVQTSTLYKGRAYINFGADYRTDFTVTVSPEDMKLFRQARFDVRKLAGQRVRVRGWIEFYNGPEMVIAHPSAIETIH